MIPLDHIVVFFQVITCIGMGALVFLAKYYLPSYVKEKGKNLATREDIAEITDKIESVKIEYAKELESLKSHLNAKFHAHTVRFEKEFMVFEELWACLVDLRDATRRLRPVMDYANPKDPEVAKERLESFANAYDLFYNVVHKNRPFFPQEVFEILRQLMKLVFGEASDYQMGWSSPREFDPNYWKTAEKNAREILEEIEAVCETIRKRIKEYEQN
jgi:hypothetical protein